MYRFLLRAKGERGRLGDGSMNVEDAAMEVAAGCDCGGRFTGCRAFL